MIRLHEYLTSNNIDSFLIGVELMHHVDDDTLYHELLALYEWMITLFEEEWVEKGKYIGLGWGSYTAGFYINNNHYMCCIIACAELRHRYLFKMFKEEGQVRMYLPIHNNLGVPFTLEKVIRHSKVIRDSFFNARNRINNNEY